MALNKYYPDGINIKDKFIERLGNGVCDCKYDDKPDYFVQGRNVFQRIPHPNNV